LQFATTVHRALVLIAILTIGVGAPAQTSTSHPLRTVTLHLPPGIRSQVVQVDYFLYGPFGARGGGITPTKNRKSFAIDTYVEGVAASEIKIVAYLPGCKFALLDVSLSGKSEDRQLFCMPLPSLSLRGEIFPILIAKDQPTVIEVGYLAEWANRFFGIADGAVPNFRIGTIKPDEDGQFQLELPDVHQHQSPGNGFQFILRDPRTWNIIAFLKPAENPKGSSVLAVQASYDMVRFVAEMQ
jgi:hypothetical protein